jgi:ribosomal protein L37E
MALVICPDCGNQVSDRSEMCPSCGYPVHDILKVIDQEKKQKQRKKIKKLAGLLGNLFVLLLLVGVIVKLAENPDRSGYYKGIKWGTTYEELKTEFVDYDLKIEGETTTVTQAISDYDNMKGTDGSIYYKFKNDKLYEVSVLVILVNEHENLTSDHLKQHYVDKFNKTYGKADNEANLEDYATYYWEAEKSRIDLFSLNEMTIVRYTDKNHKEV